MLTFVRSGGFTVLELLVGVLIAAILMLVGIPSLHAMTQNTRILTTSNEMLAALYLARSEAVKRQTFVTLCRSADQRQCSTDNSAEWEHGWIIFVDPGLTGQVSNPEAIIRVGGSAPPDVTVRTGNTYARYVAFGVLGVSRGNSGLPNDSFRVCDSRGSDHARAVVVNLRGRARVVHGQDQDTKITCPAV